MTAVGLLTTNKCKDAFKQVVTTGFGLPADNDIQKASVYDMGSEDLLDIYRLTGMAPIDVAELDFNPNEWAKTTIPQQGGSDPISLFSRQCTKNLMNSR